MDTAQHIALMDELCFRPFPAEQAPSDVGFGTPGYHIAKLERSQGLGDEARRTGRCRSSSTRRPGTGRWVAVAVADQDPSDEVELVAVVTVVDPP